MKYAKIIIPVTLLAVLAFWGFKTLSKNKEIIDEKAQQTETVIAQIPVNTVPVTTQVVEDKLNLIGNFEAQKELKVIAETQGRITSLQIKEGQYVSRGAVIARLNDATMQSQLTTAKASLAKAQKDVQRYENLLEVGAISQTQYEEVKLGMQNQQTNVTSIQQQLQYATVKAPMSGVVKEVMLVEGSFASPGTEIAIIVDINTLKMMVNVDEMDIVKIKTGQVVKIQTEVYPDVVFTGRVSQIGVQADASKKYQVAIDLSNNKQHPLKAGMYGEVVIPSANKQPKEVITIPRKSIVGSLKEPKVYLSKGGKAVLTNIEIGESIDEMVVVLNGLTIEDQVITTGQINLENGRQIKVIGQEKVVTLN